MTCLLCEVREDHVYQTQEMRVSVTKEHRASKNSNIFSTNSLYANRDIDAMFQSESRRSFGDSRSNSPALLHNASQDSIGLKPTTKILKSKMAEDRENAMRRVVKIGAHKAVNRGFYDRYNAASVLSAANSSQGSIDKTIAEEMQTENQELISGDLIMVPSKQSKTGWRYLQKNQLEKIREKRSGLLPGLKGTVNNSKFKAHEKGTPNEMFPDLTQAMASGGFLKEKVTGLQANFKITQRGGALLLSNDLRNKGYMDMRDKRYQIKKQDRFSQININN